jgi:hypothetical protein
MQIIWSEINALFWMLGREWDAPENGEHSNVISFYQQETADERDSNLSWFSQVGDSLLMMGENSSGMTTMDMFDLNSLNLPHC